PTWVDNMEAWLRSSGLWRIVSGAFTRPTPINPPTEANAAIVDAWDIKWDKAAGWIFLMVEDNQKIHFNGIKDDPVKMWAKLKDVYLQQKPGARFNAYDYLFSCWILWRRYYQHHLYTLFWTSSIPYGVID
ncbi:hypothetical protein M422DRAFT_187833, partial [Sphaerobolus stellatus SS14]